MGEANVPPFLSLTHLMCGIQCMCDCRRHCQPNENKSGITQTRTAIGTMASTCGKYVWQVSVARVTCSAASPPRGPSHMLVSWNVEPSRL